MPPLVEAAPFPTKNKKKAGLEKTASCLLLAYSANLFEQLTVFPFMDQVVSLVI